MTLSTGQEAIVIHNSDNILRPTVRLMNGEELNLSDPLKYRNVTICKSQEVE